MRSSFQPFLIAEQKTGLFNYLEPWIRPLEAWEPLDNAYVYRGTLNKRNGYIIFGRMVYEDHYGLLANGGKNCSNFIAAAPIQPGSLIVSDGTETFTDNGDGTLTRSPVAGGTNTINYTSGLFSIQFNNNVMVGTDIYAKFSLSSTSARPIMGIKTWTSEIDGSKKLVIFDTARAAVWNGSTSTFDPISTMTQVLWVGDNSTTTISFTTGWIAVAPYARAFAPYSISITDGTTTIVDDGAGNLGSGGNFDVGGTVNYGTGVVSLVFVSATTATITMSANLNGDYFSGGSSNFFNVANWLAPYYISPNPGYMYITNNVDPITAYNGTDLSRPPFPIKKSNDTKFINDISNCLDLDVYKNRLLVQLPTTVGSSYPSNQSIRYSAINSPTNLVADVAGNGGELSAPTDDLIASSEFLRDELVVPFSNSYWKFRFTGSDFAPFRWDRINFTKSTGAPYGTIPYDERITSIGNQGLVACDGVNVQRYDISIIDQFLAINQNAIEQCYGIRFDNINQSWMLYPSAENNASLSDSILVFNFLENTWANYQLPLSCLGIFFITSDRTWDSFSPSSADPTNWNQAQFPWNDYVLEGDAPSLLGGSLTGGYIYQMDYGASDNPVTNEDNNAISCSITSARWNPFAGLGQKVQFGYIDFYYEINTNCVLTLDFYIDNSEDPSATRTLTLDGPVNSSNSWKRIYINVVGEFLQMEISNDQPEGFRILGLILWAAPSGRLTPGLTVS